MNSPSTPRCESGWILELSAIVVKYRNLLSLLWEYKPLQINGYIWTNKSKYPYFCFLSCSH